MAPSTPQCAPVRSLSHGGSFGHSGGMATLPKAPCPSCSVPHALLPTKRIGYGSVEDHKTEPRSLVLCPGSADAAHGFSKSRRMELERADAFHVVATARRDTVVTRWALDHPVRDLFPGLPRQKWKRRSCGDGAHGPRVLDWARVEARPWHRDDRRHWVIAHRCVRRPEEISYSIANCPAENAPDQLIHVAGARRTSEAVATCHKLERATHAPR